MLLRGVQRDVHVERSLLSVGGPRLGPSAPLRSGPQLVELSTRQGGVRDGPAKKNAIRQARRQAMNNQSNAQERTCTYTLVSDSSRSREVQPCPCRLRTWCSGTPTPDVSSRLEDLAQLNQPLGTQFPVGLGHPLLLAHEGYHLPERRLHVDERRQPEGA